MDLGIATASVLAMATAAVIARAAQGSWLAPTPVMALVWAFVAGLPLVVAPDYPIRASGYLFLALVVVVGVAFGATASHFAARLAVRPARWDTRRTGGWRSPQRLYALTLVTTFAAPIAIFVAAVDTFGWMPLTSLAATVTRARYDAGYGDPAIVRALIASVYASAALGGWSAGLGRLPLWRSLVWIVPMLGVVAVNTGRAGLVLAAVLWIAYWIVGRRSETRRPMPSVLLLLRIGVLAFAALFALFFVTQFVRIGRFDPQLAGGVFDRARVYFAGAAPTFSYWFDEVGTGAPTWGRATFASVADAVGLGDRELGKYTAPVTLSPGQTGNIYTVFRPLLEDFGPLGAVLAWAALAAAAGIAWAHRDRVPGPAAGFLGAYYAFVLFGPVTTIFQWTSSTAVLIAMLVLVDERPANAVSRLPGLRQLRRVAPPDGGAG
jgi:oligosaccharide repeat unit polymerase